MNIEETKTVVQLRVLWLMAITLASVMIGVVAVLLVGLFIHNSQIDSAEVFKIIGPAFSMVIGAFVGSFATMMGMKPVDIPKPPEATNIQPDTKVSQELPELPEAVEVIPPSHEEEEDLGPF